MDLTIVEDKGRSLIRVDVVVRCGWRHEVPGKRGISHFLEHAILSGGKSHCPRQVDPIRYGTILNGVTKPEHVEFCFSAKKKYALDVMRTLMSLVFHLDLDENGLSRIREFEIAPAVVQESDYTAWELAEEWAGNLVFDWDFRSSLGTEADIVGIQSRELVDWHTRYYHGANTSINTSGDLSKEDVERIIQDADVSDKGENPVVSRIKWDRSMISVKRDETRNIEVVFGFRIARWEPAWELIRILGNYPLYRLWDRELNDLSVSTSSKLKETSSESGFFISFGATSRMNAMKIDKNLVKMLENVKIKESDVKIARKIRSLEILRMKDNRDLSKDKAQEMMAEIDDVDADEILSLTRKALNEENAVKVLVGAL